ncbi:hypothetical protein MHC_03400 [Mycoplasma haemocanis str. Illinois]|uniref:Uncharacterized protein n=1 Tax=Mycoplasma haemocanis (strain Illinois) TaxID=1111676 RepID=H6N7B8_MYCHN|nr:hypothetical protein [Mycoplasma haemocanis]AEW45540.1 hypothetical protein MHC_03400 [Mycoplasma haemocanis str. Illinois]
MSILASGITKIILGGAAMSLGAAGALKGLLVGESKEESLKTTSLRSDEHRDLHGKEGSDIKQSKTEEGTVVKSSSAEGTTPAEKKKCRLHKLMGEVEGRFQATTESELDSEIKKENKGDFQAIKNACEDAKNHDRDIFVSNKQRKGWNYYSEDQTRLKSKFDKYLGGIKRPTQ